jgi:hypothetical protein
MSLPPEVVTLLAFFAPLFSDRVWLHAQTLVIGAILCHGKRTVTQALRATGHSTERHFTNYHRVLNRAKWSTLQASRILLALIIALLPAGSTIVLGADDTIERRKGKKIKHLGCYRDGVRSTKKQVVKCWGLKWVCMMVLIKLPLSTRVWALPFLTTLARPQQRGLKLHHGRSRKKPQCRSGKTQKKEPAPRHKTSIDLVGQMIRLVRRWLPERVIVLVVDGAFAAVKLAHICAGEEVVLVSRMRLDAALYHSPEPQRIGKRGPKPAKGKRQRSLKEWAARRDTPWEEMEINWYGGKRKKLKVFSRVALWYTPGWAPVEIRYVLVRDPEGKLRDEAFFCTDREATPQQILEWVVMRWSVEVTFEESRAHVGLETQRQWSDKAIERTTPALFGLFTMVTLTAMRLADNVPIEQSAWYEKEEATFSDCLRLVRRRLWQEKYLKNSANAADVVQLGREDFDYIIDWLSLAA